MIPTPASCRKLALFLCLPVVSIEAKMEAVFPSEFTRTENVDVRELPGTGTKTGKYQYPACYYKFPSVIGSFFL